MSVVGRLWRRAPAWRACLIVALSTTALAAMFPPHLPDLGPLLHKGSHDPATGSQAHYAPQPPPKPSNYFSIDLPPPHEGRSGLIPFAGRQIPLPAGKWAEIAIMRDGGALAVQAEVLARWQSDKLTGLILVTGTPAVVPAAQVVPSVSRCGDASGLAVHDLSPVGNPDTGLQECWTMHRVAAAELKGTGTAGQDPLMARSLEKLDKLGVALPASLVASSYIRADDDGVLKVLVMFPEPVSGSSAFAHQTENWMQRWSPLLHKGFDGILKPAEVTPALARDPAASAKAS